MMLSMPQITLDVPEAVLEKVRRQSLALGLSVEQYLTLQIAIWMFTGSSDILWLDPTHFRALSDGQLLALVDGLARENPRRTFDLTFQHLLGGITPDEIAELDALPTVAKVSLVYRAFAAQAWKQRHGTPPPGCGAPSRIGWRPVI